MISKWNELVIQERENQPMAKPFNNPQFTEEDFDMIAELLRVAQVSLQESIYSLEARFPKSPFVETLRKWQEHAADIRERIEAR